MWLKFPFSGYDTSQQTAVGGGLDHSEKVAQPGHLFHAKVPLGRGGSAAYSVAQKVSGRDRSQIRRLCKPVIYLVVRRYLQYFSGLLSGGIKINAAPVFLKYVSVESPPSWLHYDTRSPNSGEWRCFIKVYEALHCVFTSDVYVVPITTRNFVIQIGNLRLRGDIMIRGYQLVPGYSHGQDERELIFSAQFHTCAVGDRTLVFYRGDLDYACNDPRFPDDHKVSVQFSNGADKGYVFQSPLVRTEPANTSVTQWDSIGDVNGGESK